VDSHDFDRVQWAKCQARAERYEEEVQLTVEEMGRTLRYFEWKRDWWLSLKPQSGNSTYPPDVQDGLRAYVCRQSHLYNKLITLFIAHWRTYLIAHSLGSSWLNAYTSRADPVPSRPSRGHQKASPSSVLTGPTVPGSSEPPTSPKSIVDAPLDSESDNDPDGEDNAVDAEGDAEGYVDDDDMFADD
jgi:hypothetical protein